MLNIDIKTFGQLIVGILLLVFGLWTVTRGYLAKYRNIKIFDGAVYIRFFFSFIIFGRDKTLNYIHSLQEETDWIRFGQFRIIYGSLASIAGLIITFKSLG